MSNCLYLSVSSLFLFFPIIVYIYNDRTNMYETALVLVLLSNLGLSFVFWTSSLENSLLHFYDGLFAKISYLLFSTYILFIKPLKYKIKLLFLVLLCLSTTLFYYSNHYSKKNWCSNHHLVCHSAFHFLVSIGCSIAFIHPGPRFLTHLSSI